MNALRYLPGKNRIPARCALVLAVAAAACHPARLPAEPVESAEAVQKPACSKPAPSGEVVDAAGAPVAGAQILLYHIVNEWGLGNGVAERAVANSAGHFAFKKPLTFQTPAGSARTDHYFLIASHEGYAPGWKAILGGTPEQASFRLQLTPPASQTFQAVDMQGQPAAGVTIWLRSVYPQGRAPVFKEGLSLTEDIGLCSGVTGAAGTLTLANLPDTQRGFGASKAGFEDATMSYTPRVGAPPFVMKPGATLEGRVIDPSGLPIAGATVWLYPRFGWNMYFLGKTDGDGRYRIGKIWSNRSEPNWGKYQVGLRDARFTAPTSDLLFTSGQTINGFDIHAVPGTQVLGKLLDPSNGKPVAGGLVAVDSLNGRENCWTDAEGRFRCRAAEGEVTAFYESPPEGAYTTEGGSPDFPSFIRANSSGAELDLTVYTPGPMGKLGALTGNIVDPDGRPVPYAKISAVVRNLKGVVNLPGWRGNTLRRIAADEAGAFRIELPVGLPCDILATSASGNQSGAASALLKGSELALPAPLALKPARIAYAILQDLSGNPLPDLSVTVVSLLNGAESGMAGRTYRSNQDGRLRMSDIDPSLTYQIEPATSQYAWALFHPSKDPAAPPQSILISDRYIVRLTDRAGHPVPIKNVTAFSVWILDGGRRVQWTNGPPKDVEKLGDDLTLDRQSIVLGKPGDRIDLTLETGAGESVQASGSIPEGNSGIIAAKITDPGEKQ